MTRALLSHGDLRQVAWIEQKKNLRIGSIVEIKGDERRWKVNTLSTLKRLKSALKTDWNVGGVQEARR